MTRKTAGMAFCRTSCNTRTCCFLMPTRRVASPGATLWRKHWEVLSRQVPCVAAKCGSRGALVHVGGRLTRIPPLTVNPVETIVWAIASTRVSCMVSCAVRAPLQCAAAGNITGALSTLRAWGNRGLSRFRVSPTLPARTRVSIRPSLREKSATAHNPSLCAPWSGRHRTVQPRNKSDVASSGQFRNQE